jgi:hypothetical protein
MTISREFGSNHKIVAQLGLLLDRGGIGAKADAIVVFRALDSGHYGFTLAGFGCDPA